MARECRSSVLFDVVAWFVVFVRSCPRGRSAAMVSPLSSREVRTRGLGVVGSIRLYLRFAFCCEKSCERKASCATGLGLVVWGSLGVVFVLQFFWKKIAGWRLLRGSLKLNVLAAASHARVRTVGGGRPSDPSCLGLVVSVPSCLGFVERWGSLGVLFVLQFFWKKAAGKLLNGSHNLPGDKQGSARLVFLRVFLSVVVGLHSFASRWGSSVVR